VKGKEGIQNLAIAYIALWAISPPLFINDVARLLVLVATAAWLFVELLRKSSIVYRPTGPVILAVAFIAYSGILNILMSGPSGLLSELQIWIMLFFLIIYQGRRNDLQSLAPVFWFVLAILPAWSFITVKTILTENPHAARVVVRSSLEAEALLQQGVGGYGLVYGVILLLPCLLILLLNGFTPKRAHLPKPLQTVPSVARGLLLLNLGLSVVLVLTAAYSIATITMFIVIALTISLNRYSAFRLAATVFALLVFFVLAVPLLEWLLTSILPFAEGTNYAMKINDVLRSLQIGDAVGTAEGRVERYARSIRLFIENPLVGTLVVDDVGKHSEILDTYAQWGVILGSILVYLISFLPLRVLRADKTRFGAGLAMLVAVAMVFGLNNGFAAAGLMLYIMFPVGSHMLKNLVRKSENRIRAAVRA
jgi:hypothetical protein